MHQLPRLLAALAAPALLLVAACGNGQGAAPAGPGQLRIVAAFYPLQYAAEGVAGPGATVDNLTQPGAEAHDLELTPKQVASLSTADVVIYQKGFQAAVDRAVEQARPKRVIDAAAVMELHPAEAADGHDHHAGDGHDHGPLDPHAWLDPRNMAALTRAIGVTLGEVRPEEKDAYARNAAATAGALDQLDQQFTAGLRQCQRREFITSHAAFGYLAGRYGLEQVGVRGLSPDGEPSPARIADVQTIAREHGVTTIFYETLVSPAVSESIAKDLGLRTDVLDPLEGLTDRSRGKNYVEVMQSNLVALRTANGCA